MLVIGPRFIGPRCPAPYVVGTGAILGCLYLLYSLPGATLLRFVGWNAIGLLVYMGYGDRKSFTRRQALTR